VIFATAYAEESAHEEEKEEEYLQEVEGEGGFDLNREEALVRAKVSLARRVGKHFYLGIYTQYESPDQVLGVFGPTFALKGLEVTLGFGLETNEMPLLGLSRFAFKHKHAEVDAILTVGSLGLWYEGSALARLGPIGIGPYIQKEDGVAPRLALYLKDFTVLITAPTYNWDTKGTNLIAGLRWQPKN
jgi:hypothetical protein